MSSQPHFDESQFSKRARAVSVETCIAHSDFARMHVEKTHKPESGRRRPTPDWARTAEGIRKVVLRLCERRLYLRSDESLPDDERLRAIEEATKQRLPIYESKLKSMMDRYQAAATAGASQYELDNKAMEVQIADSEVVLMRRGLPAIMTAVIYYYYNLGWTSVKVAEQLKIKSPLVRIWLWRMRRMVDGLDSGGSSRSFKSEHMQEKIRQAFMLFASGAKIKEVAKALRISPSTVFVMKRFLRNNPGFHRRLPGHRYVRYERTANGRRVIRWVEPATTRPNAEVWTGQRLEILRELVAAGKSRGEIARLLCTTAAAVSYAKDRLLTGKRYRYPRKRHGQDPS